MQFPITIAALVCSLPLTFAAPTIQIQLASAETPETRYTSDTTSWAQGATNEYAIHSSCNASEAGILRRALRESDELALHAKNHILRWGNSSESYRYYFGSNTSTAEVVGWYERIANADKAGVIFRCDDPDQRCVSNPTYNGYWRGAGANANENNICQLSYTSRKWLNQLCMGGYTVAGNQSYSTYFAADLHHRLLHTPKVSEYIVDHYADGFANITELAKTHPEEAVRNTHSLTHFALDVYARDIVLPGEGCRGTLQSTASASPASATSATSAAATSPATSSVASSSTVGTTLTTTSSAAANCHTHANGDVHCGSD